MNREIKFRGKRVDNGEWVYGDLIKRSNRICIWIDFERGGIEYGLNKVDPETVGQYTGLKDKDGKEIYEGDVVRHTLNVGDNAYDGNKSKVRISYVVWQNFRAVFAIQMNPFANNDLWKYCQNGGDATIIGNIHDNPELTQE